MKSFIGNNPDASVAQAVSKLVAEGGRLLESDDAPTTTGQGPLETTVPANTGRPTSRVRAGSSSRAAPSKILLLPGVQRRATLHLPSPAAFTKETKPSRPTEPCKVRHRPRARMTLGRVRSVNGSS
jgi:hypothetical protein